MGNDPVACCESNPPQYLGFMGKWDSGWIYGCGFADGMFWVVIFIGFNMIFHPGLLNVD
jgi:hypothetical protein